MKLASFVQALVVSAALPHVNGAELGDFDGDGKLTIADVVSRMDGLEPASGSLDGLQDAPELARLPKDESDPWLRGVYAGVTYLESLRRGVPDPLTHWIGG